MTKVTMTRVGEDYYPDWAIKQAHEVIAKHGGSLQSTVKAVLLLHKADRRAVKVDINAPGRGFSHNIGGYVVIKETKNRDKK